MSVCIDLGYEVYDDTVTVTYSNTVDQEVRVPYPTGKKPVSWGANFTPGSLSHAGKAFDLLKASYPDEANGEWVFVFNTYAGGLPANVDIYVTFIKM